MQPAGDKLPGKVSLLSFQVIFLLKTKGENIIQRIKSLFKEYVSYFYRGTL